MINGSWNFGVWNPPTGIDAIRYSECINFNLINKLNNIQTREKEGLKQSFGVSLPKFENPDVNSIVYLNDNSLKVFTGMTQQGWGGNHIALTPAPTPAPTLTPRVIPNPIPPIPPILPPVLKLPIPII